MENTGTKDVKISADRLKQLEELEKRNNTDKEKRASYTQRRNLHNRLLQAKALAQGITVTDKEIDDYLKSSK